MKKGEAFVIKREENEESSYAPYREPKLLRRTESKPLDFTSCIYVTTNTPLTFENSDGKVIIGSERQSISKYYSNSGIRWFPHGTFDLTSVVQVFVVHSRVTVKSQTNRLHLLRLLSVSIEVFYLN